MTTSALQKPLAARTPHPLTKQVSKFVSVVIFSLSLIAFSTAVAVAQPCIDLLSVDAQFVRVNQIPVTGEFLFPLQTVIENLGVTPQLLERYRAGQTLSVAEGVSSLLPYLLKNGMNAKATDLWYDRRDLPENESGALMRRYQALYGSRLITTDARRLNLPDESFDLILSHQLLNNLSTSEIVKVIREAVRILKPGGAIRMNGIGENEVEILTENLHELNGDLQSSSRRIEFSFEHQTFFDRPYGAKPTQHTGYRIQIEKAAL